MRSPQSSLPTKMPCASLGRDEKKCAKRVTTHSPGIPLKSNSRVPQPVLCRNLCRRKERQSTSAAHEDLLRSALPRRVRYEVTSKVPLRSSVKRASGRRFDASSCPAFDAKRSEDPSRSDFGPKVYFSEKNFSETVKFPSRRTQPLLLFTHELFRLRKSPTFDPLSEGPRAHFWRVCVCRS